MRKKLLTGLLTLLPLTLTVIIIIYVLNLLTNPFTGVVENFLISFEGKRGVNVEHHQTLILFISRLIILVLIFLFILVLGYIARRFFFHYLVTLFNRVVSRIPFVRGIYRVSREVTKAMFSEDTKAFKRTVLVPFPQNVSHALGFVTGEVPSALKSYLKDSDIVVFVPTAPHPLSGFILFTSQNRLTNVDVTTEDAFKFLVSCGVIHPGQNTPTPKN